MLSQQSTVTTSHPHNRFMSHRAVRAHKRSADASRRARIAANTRHPIQQVAELAKDSSEVVRASLLSRPDVDVDSAIMLSADPQWKIRRLAVQTGRLPDELLVAMAHTETSPEVLLAIAELPDAPDEAVRALATSELLHLRHTVAKLHARRTLMHPRALAEYAWSVPINKVIDAWDLPQRSDWAEILNDPEGDEHVQVLLASSARWRVSALSQLLEHSSPLVRQAVKYNPRCYVDPADDDYRPTCLATNTAHAGMSVIG